MYCGTLVSFCLVLLLLGLALLFAVITYKKTKIEILPMIVILITLGLFGYLFQFLDIILSDALVQFEIYWLK